MTDTLMFFPHAIDFADGDLITQLTNVTPSYGFQDIVEFSAGDTSPMWSGSLSSAPAVAFSTRQIKSILDLADPAAVHGNGKVVAYDAQDASDTIEVYLRKGEAYGLRESDATVEHEKVQLTQGFMSWSTISAQQNQLAEIACQLVATYDANNDPLIFTQSALTGITKAVNHLFTLGPIKLNGTALMGGLQGFTLSNNAAIIPVFDSGISFPRYIGIASFSPTIVARVRDATLMRSIGTRGAAVTSLTCYLRKLSASAIAVADATQEHISFSATAGTVKARQVDNQGLVDLFIQLHKPDAITHPYTFDTTAAITYT